MGQPDVRSNTEAEPACNDPDEYYDEGPDDDLCPYCDGTGSVTPTSHHHPKQLVLGREECWACDGSGKI